jgi:hypothetical protein
LYVLGVQKSSTELDPCVGLQSVHGLNFKTATVACMCLIVWSRFVDLDSVISQETVRLKIQLPPILFNTHVIDKRFRE